MFAHMVALQDLAFRAIRPGSPCSDVDAAVRAYFDEHELWPYWRHHTGHAIGLRYHEGPFLDSGDHTEIRPGMVFTVEPGLYAPDLGGFRHSDTVLVTDDGLEILTCVLPTRPREPRDPRLRKPHRESGSARMSRAARFDTLGA